MPASAIAALGLLTLTLHASVRPESTAAQENVVRAVLFFSPACPHCATVIRDVLPTVFAGFGGQPDFYQGRWGHVISNGQLEVLLVDASHAEGRALYQTSSRRSAFPRIGRPSRDWCVGTACWWETWRFRNGSRR